MPRRGSSCSGDRRFPDARRGACLGALVALITLFGGLPAGPAAAESPTQVTAELGVDGVYIAPERTEIEEEGLAAEVQRARARGLRLVVVAPIDPQPDAAAFARRIQEASDADVAIVFPPDGGLEAHVIDEFESAQFRALAAARSKAAPVDAVAVFNEELLTEPARTLPPIVGQTISMVVLLALILAGAVALEQFLRRIFRARRQAKFRDYEDATA